MTTDLVRQTWRSKNTDLIHATMLKEQPSLGSAYAWDSDSIVIPWHPTKIIDGANVGLNLLGEVTVPISGREVFDANEQPVFLPLLNTALWGCTAIALLNSQPNRKNWQPRHYLDTTVGKTLYERNASWLKVGVAQQSNVDVRAAQPEVQPECAVGRTVEQVTVGVVDGLVLPDELGELRRALDESRRFVDWVNPAYEDVPTSRDAWERSVRQVAKMALGYLEAHASRPLVPSITDGPEGSIDVAWDIGTRRILINFAAASDLPDTFFKLDRVNPSATTLGCFEPEDDLEQFLPWLME